MLLSLLYGSIHSGVLNLVDKKEEGCAHFNSTMNDKYEEKKTNDVPKDADNMGLLCSQVQFYITAFSRLI